MDQVGVVDLEGLADVLNGNGEDGGTYRDLHAVHDRHGQGDLQRCGHSPAGITGDDHRAAHVLHIPLDHIHANAAAEYSVTSVLVEKPGAIRKLRISLWEYSTSGRAMPLRMALLSTAS